MPISEVELELKSGDPAELFAFALQLQNAVPLRVGNISKANAAMRCRAQPPAVIKAAHLELPRRLSAEQGFQVITGNCLTQIQGNETGSRRQRSGKVHQMRVGLRRLRSALGLFAEVAPCPAALQAELDWLATALGAARDWEVLSGSTLAVVASACPDEPVLVQLQQAAIAVAQENRQKAARAVGSIRYALLFLTLGGWIQGARWRELLVESERGAFSTARKIRCADTRALLWKIEEARKQLRGAHQRRAIGCALRLESALRDRVFESLYPAKRVRPFVER